MLKFNPLLLGKAVLGEVFLAVAWLILVAEDLNTFLDVERSSDRGEV
jgi:hypothetical protein